MHINFILKKYLKYLKIVTKLINVYVKITKLIYSLIRMLIEHIK